MRNARCFENQEKLMEELKHILVKSLFTWTGAYDIPHVFNFSEFVPPCTSFNI